VAAITDAFTETVDSLLAKSVNTTEVKSLLASLGESAPLKINSDVGGAYVSRQQLGVSLFFQDPPRASNPTYHSLPKGILILYYCFFYSEGHEGYKQFTGKLPRGLSFSDSRDQIIQKLGQPNWKREKQGRTISEGWDNDNRSLHVTYFKDRDGIKILGYGVVDG
jgi:hypothetical protein